MLTRMTCPACFRTVYKEDKFKCLNGGCPRYRQGDRFRFKAGTWVLVKGYEKAGPRKVECVYDPEIEGGRRLDRPVDGHVSWNVMDLKKAKAR